MDRIAHDSGGVHGREGNKNDARMQGSLSRYVLQIQSVTVP